MFVEQNGEINMINTIKLVVDEILKHHGDVNVGSLQERGVPSDILLDIPEGARVERFRGTGAKKLSAGEPYSGNTVGLISGDRPREVEDDVGPPTGARERRGIGDGDGRAADGVAEGVAEERN